MTTPNFDWLNSLTTAFDPASPAAATIMNVLVPTGQHLFLSIATLYLAFISLRIMLDEGGALAQIGTLVNAFITFGLVAFILYDYPLFLGQINDGFSQIANLIAGGVGTAGSADLILQGFHKIISQALLVYNSIPPLHFSFSDLFDLDNSSKLLSAWTIDLVASLFTMLALVVAGVLYLVIFAYSMMLFTVGATLGPILLPWILLGPLKFVGEGWIKFMISAGMYRVVAMAIITILSPFISQMNSMIADQAAFFNAPPQDELTAQTQHLFFSVSVFVFSLATLYMLTKVPEIVSGLLSGGGGGGLKLGMPGGRGGSGGGNASNSPSEGQNKNAAQNIAASKIAFLKNNK